MLATTPALLAPCEANIPSSSQCCWSGSLVRITSAHLRPGRFHALDADVAVSAGAAAVSEGDAYGAGPGPGDTGGAWSSSAQSRPPCRAPTAAVCRVSH